MVHAGGITHLRRIADLAELYNVRTGFHGATDLSPVCMAAALHFDLSVPELRHPGIHAPHRRDRRGLPARLAGTNMWYAAYLGVDAPFGNRARLKRELDRLVALGIDNVRILGSSELLAAQELDHSRPSATAAPTIARPCS